MFYRSSIQQIGNQVVRFQFKFIQQDIMSYQIQKLLFQIDKQNEIIFQPKVKQQQLNQYIRYYLIIRINQEQFRIEKQINKLVSQLFTQIVQKKIDFRQINFMKMNE
ncbi:hypothetical protein ABPG74_011542 [Tetrahymena malaccensis]